jgi:phenylacetyl-CoA:acceptor oxidoreductase subunit 2
MKHIGTRLQTNWDWRAAGNFVLGGAGAGLLAIAAVAAFPAPPSLPLLLLALAMIATGLGLVWIELGRPWRAVNVFFHGETSWMTREAMVATLMFLLALAGLLSQVAGLLQAAAVAGLAFVYCQARMLQAAKGIVTWREPAVIPFMLLTALTEGGGLLLLAADLLALHIAWLPYLVVLLLALRALSWMHYRSCISASAGPLPARTALARISPLVLIGGHVLPVMLLIAALAVPSAPALNVTSALLAVACGWFVKAWIVVSAAYQQGYAFGRLRRGLPA